MLIYIFFSSLWILGSDALLANLIDNLAILSQLQTLKGWVFVLLSSGIIYRIIRLKNVGFKPTSIVSSGEEVQNFLDAIPALVFVFDRESRYLNILSTQGEGLYRDRDVLLGKTLYEVFEESQAKVFHNYILESLEINKTVQVQYSLPIHNKISYFSANISPLSDNTVVWVAQNITAEKETQKALTACENYYQDLFESNPCPMWVYDVNSGEFLAINDSAIALYGYSKKEFLSLQPQDICSPEDMSFFQKTEGNSQKRLNSQEIYKHRKKDGTMMQVKLASHSLNFLGRQARAIVVQDLTQRQQAEAKAKQKDKLYHTLAQNFPNGAVLLFDRDLRYTLTEGTELKKIGFSKEDLEGKTIWQALPSEICNSVEPLYQKALRGESVTQEISYGEQIYEVHILPIRNEEGEINGGMVVTQNITQHKQFESTLKQFAFYDSSTALPNQNSLLQRLETLLKPKSETNLFAVVFLELERFETIKYSLGHSLAEQLLVATAQRLHSCFPHSGKIARVGDKSLAIIVEDIVNEKLLSSVIDCIHSHLNYPIQLFEHEILSPVKIGVAFGGENANLYGDYERPEDILHAAATAMHHSKVNNSFRYTVFHPSMFQQAVARLQLETDLRRGIDQQQLQVYYQPIISLESGKITGFEALVRWQHPTQGLISPTQFLPLATETGLIARIDLWVMGEACKQLSRWNQAFAIPNPLMISINLSGQLLSQVGLLENIENIIAETGVDGNSIKLEVVESVVMEQQAIAKEILAQLRHLGVKLSIDDFGTGYSCLERLHSLPLDTLKIDRSFVQDMMTDENRLEIVKTIVALAHSLGLDLIAEGIETDAQLEQLRSLGCEYGQGYYFSRPVDALSVEALLQQQYS